MPYVEILDGPGRGPTCEILETAVTIGRGSEHPICISDRSVSRTHAEIFRVGELSILRDLGSRNGTFVNEERIQEEHLRANDRIRIGNTEMVFREGPPPMRGAGPRVRPDTDIAEKATTIEYRIDHADPADLVEPTMAETASLNSKPFQDLSQVIAICAEERDPALLLQRVLTIAGESIDADRGYIFIRSPGSQEMKVRGRFDKESPESGGTRASDALIRNMARKVISESRSVLAVSQPRDPDARGVKSAICAPLFSTKAPKGVLFLHSTESGREFTKTDLDLVTTMALQVGIAYRSLESSE
jgi:predicted component of type VI protein secretion system